MWILEISSPKMEMTVKNWLNVSCSQFILLVFFYIHFFIFFIYLIYCFYHYAECLIVVSDKYAFSGAYYITGSVSLHWLIFATCQTVDSFPLQRDCTYVLFWLVYIVFCLWCLYMKTEYEGIVFLPWDIFLMPPTNSVAKVIGH